MPSERWCVSSSFWLLWNASIPSASCSYSLDYISWLPNRLNQAVAVSLAGGPREGLRLLAPLAAELSDYAPYHLAHADMLHRSGQVEPARRAYCAALDLTQNQVEREFILERIAGLGDL